MYCAATEDAVRRFQSARGLRAEGTCDEHTWTALVEANWSLGDRLLHLTAPNLRGDDVAEVQGLLARLGFDCGRVDGILGPRTSKALADFQANCGLVADGVCGPVTAQALLRVSGQTGNGPGVAAVRERERLRHDVQSLAMCRVVIGQFGGLSGVVRTLTRTLRLHGAVVMALDEPDAVAQALVANQFAATVYLGIEASPDPTAVAHYYKVPSFESVGGRFLAEQLVEQLRLTALGQQATLVGMRLPVLRETRMPAVLLTIGPVRQVTDATPDLAAAVVRSLELWISRAT